MHTIGTRSADAVLLGARVEFIHTAVSCSLQVVLPIAGDRPYDREDTYLLLHRFKPLAREALSLTEIWS